MAGGPSAWRVNDVVAYDVMREASISLVAELVAVARAGGKEADGARHEILEVRRETLAVDGSDRAAIDAQTKQLERRILELAAF